MKDIFLERPNRSQTIKAIIFFSFSIIIIISIIILYFKALNQKIERDEYLCPKVGIGTITAVILDLSDTLSEIQKVALTQHLENIKSNIKKDCKIDLYTIKPLQRILSPDISICNPGRPEDYSKWSSNPKMIEKKWKEDFSGKLNRIIDGVMKDNIGLDSSPIMESLKQVNILSFGIVPNNTMRRFIVISDMIENSNYLNQYHEDLQFKEFQKSDKFINVKSNYNNAEFEIIYIRRTVQQVFKEKSIYFFGKNL